MALSLSRRINRNKVQLVQNLHVDHEFLSHFSQANLLSDSVVETILVRFLRQFFASS